MTDVNDRPPVFKFQDYQKEIPENSPVGSVVLTVEANDDDTPANTQVKTVVLFVTSAVASIQF